ncbi:MAG: hypothetical protein WCS52_00590 [bacterium]
MKKIVLIMVMAVMAVTGQAQYAANNQTNTFDGVVSNYAGNYYIGNGHWGDVLVVTNNGSLTVVGCYFGNNAADSNNTAVVTGGGSLLSNSSAGVYFYVGFDGSRNQLTIQNGGTVYNGFQCAIGGGAGSNNVVLVTGAGSTFTNVSRIAVGSGTGGGNQLTITNGGRAYNGVDGKLGSMNNAVLVTGKDSTWAMSAPLTIGVVGDHNQLTIANSGLVVNTTAFIGSPVAASNNTVLVTGAGSVWSNSSYIYVGVSGMDNQMTISNGGTVYNSLCRIGQSTDSASNNTVLVTGAGSVWANGGDLEMFRTGSRVTVSDGGKAYNGKGYVGKSPAIGNLLLVTGQNSVWSNSSTLYVGAGATSNQMTISGGGAVICASGFIGKDGGNSNTGLVTGAGSVWDTRSGTLYLGSGTGGSNNQLMITSGGAVYCGDLTIGQNAASANGVLLQDSGILRPTGIVSFNGTGQSLTNAGGILEFSSVAPTITLNGNVMVMNGGTMAFRNVTTVDVKANWTTSSSVGLMSYSGNNTFQLNNATNATTLQGYTFATGMGSTNYTRLELINNSLWRGGSLTVGTGGSALFSNGTAVVQGSLTNNGGILTVADCSLTVTGACYLGSATIINMSSNSAAPSLTVGGTLTLPASATFNYTGTLTRDSQVTLMSGTPIVNLGDLSGWTGAPATHRLRVVGNSLVLTPRTMGFIIEVQ